MAWAERNRTHEANDRQNELEFKYGHFRQPDFKKGIMDRYYNIKPYNYNRIKLKVSPNELDYVNASPIILRSPSDDKRPPLQYIAMQGPVEASVDYVWRMAAEQLTTPIVIVQLTNFLENNAPKCYPYLPLEQTAEPWRLNTKDVWEDGWQAQLRFESAETLAGGAIELRKLAFRVEGEGDDRIVWHFLYTKWPDFGVPALEDLDSFLTLMRLSREYNTGGGIDDTNPRIIHCSAGVGRTGTFITLEHLMRELDAGYLEDYDGNDAAEKPDLIFKTVEALREQRKSMVQAESQYLFIYQVLRKLWQDKYGIVDEESEGEPAAKRLEIADPFVD
jgi:protein-tyrosine phosphatase